MRVHRAIILFLVCVGASLNVWAGGVDLSGATSLSPVASSPLSDVVPGKARVWVFLSAKCPCSHSHIAKLEKTFEEFSSKGVDFVGMHSNQDESAEDAKNYFSGVHLNFSVYNDSGAHIADHFGALKTPHVFIESPDHRILYQGGIDDSNEASSTEANYLRDALREIVAGKPVSRPRARSLGCVISRKGKS